MDVYWIVESRFTFLAKKHISLLKTDNAERVVGTLDDVDGCWPSQVVYISAWEP